MPTDSTAARPHAARSGLAGLVLLLAGCAVVSAPPPPAAAAPPAPLPEAAEPRPAAPLPAPAPAATPEPGSPPWSALFAPEPVAAVLDYADRVRVLPAPELAQELTRLGDTPFSPTRALQLALALAQARQPAQLPRAQALLQRVLAQRDAEAGALHPLARLLAAQLVEQRRLDEQLERQALQLREAQRRIEQLNDRLEAVRAIERSLPTRQRRDTPPSPPRRGAGD